MADESVSWRGALLWPQPLPEGPVIDLSRVDAIGVWVYDWFRARPRQAVVAAPARIRRQLQRAALPILWYHSAAEASGRRSGVTPAERDLLWGDEV